MTRPAATCLHEIIDPMAPTVTGHPIRCVTVRIRPLSAAE